MTPTKPQAIAAACAALVAAMAEAQTTRPVNTLGTENGVLAFDTPDFALKLVKDSQTIAALAPKLAPVEDGRTFDFTPADQLSVRAGNKFNHFGDISVRVRQGDGAWRTFASSAARRPVTPVDVPGALAAADLSPTMGDACPVKIVRSWHVDGGRLVVRFQLTNTGTSPVTIGALDFPVVFNNMIQDFRTNKPRTLAEANHVCSFIDPYVGLDGGYLQVTRLNGAGPALVVVPERGTPFEAFRPLHRAEEASPIGQTFEGAMAWTVRSAAFAENEWKGVEQWNPPTSQTLAPGESVSHGLRLLVSPTIRDIDHTLAADKRPVVVGVPGYILPTDQDGKLFIDPAGRGVAAIVSEPADALTIESAAPTKSGKLAYAVRGKQWGRSRIAISYDDGTRQTVNYYVTKPAAETVDDLGKFLFTKQWFTDETDPFHRAPSVITYDRKANKQVTQDTRVWFSGLSDEAGSGSWLAATMKQFGRPDAGEVAKLAEFVDKTVWGDLQYADGPKKYGVKKSLFFYQPDLVPDFKYIDGNWKTWASWNKKQADDIGRGYNYPHVVAAYWTLYRLSRNHPGLVTARPWEWYLDQAFNTTKFMLGGFGPEVGYVDTGLMEGDVFLELLRDLRREGHTEKADYIEAGMKKRADHWKSLQYPFGSEMAWDSTGQEEVYAWTRYFGYTEKAEVSLNSVLGCMPTVPHWGYNGNARRYWDFIYGAAPRQGIERQIHHYGSGINAIPVLTQFRSQPDDFYLLRVGYGGSSGALTNIDREGFASCAFHADPAKLRWDDYSGDYGPNFFGHAMTTGTYVVDHPDYGWLAFGGNLTLDAGKVTVRPKDTFRRRVYVAPLGLFLTLDAGAFESLTIDPAAKTVRLELAPADAFTPAARLRVEQPARIAGVGAPTISPVPKRERESYVIELGKTPVLLDMRFALP